MIGRVIYSYVGVRVATACEEPYGMGRILHADTPIVLAAHAPRGGLTTPTCVALSLFGRCFEVPGGFYPSIIVGLQSRFGYKLLRVLLIGEFFFFSKFLIFFFAQSFNLPYFPDFFPQVCET